VAQVSDDELRSNLASYLDQVCDDGTPLLVTRPNARNVVLISGQDYGGLIDTIHLLESPANADRLLRSISQADQGELPPRERP
jgi:antitoxin YefM